MRLKDKIKNMEREELEDFTLRLNESFLKFEKYLMEKIGTEEYKAMAKDFAIKDANAMLKRGKKNGRKSQNGIIETH